MDEEPMMKWFGFLHLPSPLLDVSEYIDAAAIQLCNTVQPGPERAVALRKLREAKDAAVRATRHPGG